MSQGNQSIIRGAVWVEIGSPTGAPAPEQCGPGSTFPKKPSLSAWYCSTAHRLSGLHMLDHRLR
eukprot:7129424-Pyramimonas_sp.AAC.1